MFYQEAPRKSLKGCTYPIDKGFWVEGKDKQDCINQLKEYAKQNPKKWIYIYDCGLGASYPVPVAKHLFEVSIYDKEPACFMVGYILFQSGCENKKEIDDMTEEQQTELRRKQLNFFYTLGNIYRNKGR